MPADTAVQGQCLRISEHSQGRPRLLLSGRRLVVLTVAFDGHLPADPALVTTLFG